MRGVMIEPCFLRVAESRAEAFLGGIEESFTLLRCDAAA